MSASLTNTAVFTKKFMVWAAIFAVFLISTFFAVSVSGDIKNSLFPPKADPAFVAFYKLPELDLTEGVIPPKNVTYDIETVSGQLEELVDKMRVFGIKEPIKAFGDLEMANETAANAGFKVPPISTNAEKATYLGDAGSNKTLEIELTSKNIFVNSDYLTSQEVITTQAKNESQSQNLAMQLLSNLDIKVVDFPEDKIEFLKFKVDGGKLTEALSLSSSNIMEVNFNRADIDKIPVVTPLFGKPKVRILVSSKGVAAAKITVSNIQKYKFSTYPLKGVKKAFEDLKSGKAIYNKPFKSDVFEIRSVSLAYLDTEKYQSYLQPVYVFHADEGLDAYVRAVDNAWVENN